MHKKHPSNHNITQSLTLSIGKAIDLNAWLPVSGGSIHHAWQVTTTAGNDFFIKTNRLPQYPMFQAEAKGLTHIKHHLTADNPLRVPHVYTVGHDEHHAWLILEYIPFKASTPSSEYKLGQGTNCKTRERRSASPFRSISELEFRHMEPPCSSFHPKNRLKMGLLSIQPESCNWLQGLALLHQQQQPQFGLADNNFIGKHCQHNQPQKNWFLFFTQQRLKVQYQLAKQHGFYHQLATQAEQLQQVLPLILGEHQPKASLLHGDLWSGNKACDAQHNPIIFDPAIYYGDHESDMAMTELFSGFSADFYAAYRDVYPISSGYQQRKHLYNLYHILNHANLFGGSYIQKSKHMIQQIIAPFGHT